MAAANVIPGVSGSSVALATGIYKHLVVAIAAFDREALRLLYKFRFAEFWNKIEGNFLAPVLLGIFSSIVFLSRLMTYLLTHHAILVGSFFFGALLICLPLVLRQVKKWNLGAIAALFLGAAAAYSVTLLTRIQVPDAFWVVLVAGILTTTTMMLPGITSTVGIFLLGKYQLLRSAVLQFNLPVIVIFLIGCAVGLIASSRFFSWALDNYHNTTYALFSGFMLGSLNKVWPWRDVIEFVTNGKGEQLPVFDSSILPWNYLASTGKDPQVFQAILMMALGVFIVVLIEKIAARLKTKI